MPKLFSYTVLVIIFILGIWACSHDSNKAEISNCNKDEVVSSKLISVVDAANLLKQNSHVIPIEISKPTEFKSGHISTAINVWRPDFRSKIFSTYNGMICTISGLEALMQNLGLTDTSHLLLYDNKGGCDAMRLSWVLDCYGYKNYQVLNGGKTAWRQAGKYLDTVDIAPVPNPSFRYKSGLDTSLYASMQDVEEAIHDENTIIVDTREPYEYKAEPFTTNGKVWKFKKGAFDRGSIPSAVHLNWSDLSDLADDHRIKCKKDLIFDLTEKGISPDKKVIVYCQSGSRSSHTAFVLREILGYTNVKNYDGSWIEWSYYHKNGNRVPIDQLTSEIAFEKLFTKLTENLNNNNEQVH